ncbi:MAG: transposase [Rhodospirillaceae bacterium]|nr:transposase [Rhodospirillaceae bacterium]
MSDGIRRRRRRYSKSAKRRVVAETFEAGASVAAVARKHGLNANMLFTWRRDPRFGPGREVASFVPVEMTGPQGPASMPAVDGEHEGRIEIILASGVRLALSGGVDADLVLRLARGLSA